MIFKIRGKIDLKINWSLKMPFHWHKGVARSVLWDPGNVKKSRELKEMFSCKAKFKSFVVNLNCDMKQTDANWHRLSSL